MYVIENAFDQSSGTLNVVPHAASDQFTATSESHAHPSVVTFSFGTALRSTLDPASKTLVLVFNDTSLHAYAN